MRSVSLIGGTIPALYFSRCGLCALCMSDWRDYFCSVFFTLYCMCALYVWLEGLFLLCTFHAVVYVRSVCLIGRTVSALYFSRCSVCALCMSDWSRDYFCSVFFTRRCMCALYVWLEGLFLLCTFHAKVYVRCMSDWRDCFCSVLFTL